MYPFGWFPKGGRGKRLPEQIREDLDDGCIGLCRLYQHCQADQPEYAPGTECYAKPEQAVARQCAEGEENFVFAKQGYYSAHYLTPPDPDPVTGRMPNDAISDLVLINGELVYHWNYVIYFPPNSYVWMDIGVFPGRRRSMAQLGRSLPMTRSIPMRYGAQLVCRGTGLINTDSIAAFMVLVTLVVPDGYADYGATKTQEYARRYTQATTEREKLLVAIDAIDAGVIRRDGPVADFDAVFGTDAMRRLPRAGSDRTTWATAYFGTPVTAPRPNVQETMQGWRLSIQYDYRGIILNYHITNTDK